MLMGEHSHTVDAKGRVILPAEFREELGERFVITRGLETCLWVFGELEWNTLSRKLAALPVSKKEVRDVTRFFMAGARQLECDRQGRFLIPANLRDYARLSKDAVLNGMINRIEVWSKTEWESYSAGIQPSVTNLADALADLGI